MSCQVSQPLGQSRDEESHTAANILARSSVAMATIRGTYCSYNRKSTAISHICCANIRTYCNCYAIGRKSNSLELQIYAQSAKITLSAAVRSNASDHIVQCNVVLFEKQ